MVWKGLHCIGFVKIIVEITAASSNNGGGRRRVLGFLCVGQNRARSINNYHPKVILRYVFWPQYNN